MFFFAAGIRVRLGVLSPDPVYIQLHQLVFDVLSTQASRKESEIGVWSHITLSASVVLSRVASGRISVILGIFVKIDTVGDQLSNSLTQFVKWLNK
jgi:hypothetical protein